MNTFYDINSPYTICVKNHKTNEIKEITLEKKELFNRADYNEKFSFEFYEKESIAILHYNSCKLNLSDQRLFNSALSAAFSKMKKENFNYLFIDITKNEGGDTGNNDLLFEYLNTIKDKTKLTLRFNKAIVASLMESDMKYNKDYINNKDIPFFKRLRLKFKIKRLERKLPSILQTGIVTLKENHPKNNHGFKGQVFVIQSRETYSAAIDFATSFRRKKAGIIVGEKAGAPAIYCGNIINDTLPNSKIAISYSIRESIYSPHIDTDKDGFLTPDIPYDTFGRELNLKDFLNIIEINKQKQSSCTN